MDKQPRRESLQQSKQSQKDQLQSKKQDRVKNNWPKNHQKGKTKSYRIRHDCEAVIRAKQRLALLQQNQQAQIGMNVQGKVAPSQITMGGGKNQWVEVNLDTLELNRRILDNQTSQKW